MARTTFRSWVAYRKAFLLAREVNKLAKRWPKEERFRLIDQIIRSSRSVCANLAEGYTRRRYPRHFRAKVTDAASENDETQTWLDFALDCKYIDQDTYTKLCRDAEEVGRILNWMYQNPENFRPKKSK